MAIITEYSRIDLEGTNTLSILETDRSLTSRTSAIYNLLTHYFLYWSYVWFHVYISIECIFPVLKPLLTVMCFQLCDSLITHYLM